jgi:glycosyltransferase involved in cell wall biosynthesis
LIYGIPKTAIVVFNHGPFGGAAKRYTYLFKYLDKKYPGNFIYIINNHLYGQVTSVFNNINTANIKIADIKEPEHTSAISEIPKYYADNSVGQAELDQKAYLPRKVFWYYKNMFRQKKLYRQIERLRRELDIKFFIGVFGGIIPLTFYMNTQPKLAGTIFADMDSWFTDILGYPKKLWYRKFYSFNYALENSDAVDFLSPYILDGVKKLGVKIIDERAFVAPCSFIDYSMCKAGSKSELEIAFASRLEPDKNPMLFLEAVKIIHTERPDIKFHLLGEGSLVNEIGGFIKRNDLDSCINFRFHINPPEIFSGTSIFVSLQSNTNYPSQSVLEAMACGNAIIASDTGDTKLFINKNNGILISLNAEELVNALHTLINNKKSTQKMGGYAAKYARQNHTIEKYSEYYLDLINKFAP